MRIRSFSGFERFSEQIKGRRKRAKRRVISISCGTCGLARGAKQVVDAFLEGRRKLKLSEKISFKVTGCHNFCEAEPNVVILPKGIFYQKLKPEDAEEVLIATAKGRVVERLLHIDPISKERFIYKKDIPFYKKQVCLLTENNILIDPTRIEDYIALGGYTALAKALKTRPKQIIEDVKKSGLRGRGGAGFPTGTKWEICRSQPQDHKYIICNADEGDPGAYMNRSLLEGNPHSVLEGMIIGGYAIGAREGVIYVRTEYPLAVKNIGIAISQAYEYGFLGKNILGTRFSFDITVVRGAGAFVCGEETALMASCEGRRGMPRPRPPFPAEKGLWDKPTNINNVETWANVPLVINRGPEVLSKIGTETSKGTKIFSLVGKINNTGLVEVPMGITLGEVVEDVGRGIPENRRVKAIQIGGPSGGCIPKKLFHLPVDYESLTGAGAIMGSGGMIVMDETNCMVDIAKYFMNFLRSESCGKCPPCREGTQILYEILDKITKGEGSEESLKVLEDVAKLVNSASLCGLGQTAPNPVLSTIRYFRHEYEAHINEKRCPALVCKPLLTYSIIEEKCVGCLLCLKACPSGAITGELKKPHKVDQAKCIKCGACYDVCPKKIGAVLVR